MTYNSECVNYLQKIVALSNRDRPFKILPEYDAYSTYHVIHVGDIAFHLQDFSSHQLFDALVFFTAAIGVKEGWYGYVGKVKE